MRRYHLGRIAALLAAVYVTAVVVSGVLALTTGDPTLLREIVTGGWGQDFLPSTWWIELLVVAGGILQGWAYWQILRGRPAGPAVVNAGPVRLLRVALYVSVACTLLIRLPIPYQWWFGLPGDLVKFAVVWLFFVILAGVLPRWLRLAALVAGLADAVMETASTVAYGLGMWSVTKYVSPYWLGNVVLLLWVVPVLAGQARDARWSRGTVRMGAGAAAVWLLASGGSSVIGFGGVDYDLLVLVGLSILRVFGTVWLARSAHDLGGPVPVPAPAPAAQRAAARPWPLAAVIVALPLIPAAVNLADGMPAWIGPRGAVDDLFHGYVSHPATVLWVAVDLLVGVGAPAVLILIAVVRRSRRLLRVTMTALALAAVAGVVTVLTPTPPDPDWQFMPEMMEQRLGLYPDGLFTPDENGEMLFGLSPLWYSAALAASALLLLLLYGAPPAARLRHHVLVATLATAVALCFLPVADQSRGPVTTAADCSPPDSRDTEGRPVEPPPPPTGPRAFICAVRKQETPMFAATTPDQVLLTQGRRLCASYTRDAKRELARLREAGDPNAGDLSSTLAGICPAAAAKVAAEAAAQQREYDDFDAEEQRKCDATPRHRPLIKPAKAIRLKEPEWPEFGLGLYEESAEGKGKRAGPVYAAPGQVTVSTHPDFHVCVTLETYARRPPVETKGWEHVVEVGFDNQSGEMRLGDDLSGTELPDLSLNGRKGHYRVRVHTAWFPWKGDKYGTQRLLLMAYPGPGDKIVVHR